MENKKSISEIVKNFNIQPMSLINDSDIANSESNGYNPSMFVFDDMELGIEDLKYISDKEITEEQSQGFEKRIRGGFIEFLRKNINNDNNQ